MAQNLRKVLGWIMLIIGILLVVNIPVLATISKIGFSVGSINVNLLSILFILSGVIILK